MIFDRVHADLKSNDPKEVAKVLFDFFVYQYETAVRMDISAKCDYNAAVSANYAAKQHYKNDSDYNSLGWGPKLPYGEYALNKKKEDADEAAKQRADAKIFLDFMRDRFLEKFV